jgi:GT2 family glycosyltransferase
MASPLISVIIPVYNGADVIRRALTTVFVQTLSDFEVTVVDDGSTDDLVAALAGFNDRRLTVIRQDANAGASAARNRGIRQAKGEYVAFLDCDDEWLPEKLARQYDALRSCPPNVSVCLAGYYLFRDRLKRREERRLAPERDWFWRLLGGCNLNVGSGLMVRRRVFDEIGYYDETMRRLEDWDWLLRYTANAPIEIVKEPLAIYHSGLRWPSEETVTDACAQIWRHHGAKAAAHSPSAARLLRSTIAYERAAALYHHGHPVKAAAAVVRALMYFPQRGLTFYEHLLRRGWDLVRRRFG